MTNKNIASLTICIFVLLACVVIAATSRKSRAAEFGDPVYSVSKGDTQLDIYRLEGDELTLKSIVDNKLLTGYEVYKPRKYELVQGFLSYYLFDVEKVLALSGVDADATIQSMSVAGGQDFVVLEKVQIAKSGNVRATSRLVFLASAVNSPERGHKFTVVRLESKQ